MVELKNLNFIRPFQVSIAARAEEAARKAKKRRKRRKKNRRNSPHVSRTPSLSGDLRTTRSPSFSRERPQKKKKKRKKKKDLTPREIRRRSYWRSMQAAGRQAAKVAAAPRGTPQK